MGVTVEWCQGIFEYDRWYWNKLLGLIGKSFEASKGGEHVKANGLGRFDAQHTCYGGTQGQEEVQD